MKCYNCDREIDHYATLKKDGMPVRLCGHCVMKGAPGKWAID